jgi:hypothetical protein
MMGGMAGTGMLMPSATQHAPAAGLAIMPPPAPGGGGTVRRGTTKAKPARATGATARPANDLPSVTTTREVRPAAVIDCLWLCA